MRTLHRRSYETPSGLWWNYSLCSMNQLSKYLLCLLFIHNESTLNYNDWFIFLTRQQASEIILLTFFNSPIKPLKVITHAFHAIGSQRMFDELNMRVWKEASSFTQYESNRQEKRVSCFQDLILES